MILPILEKRLIARKVAEWILNSISGPNESFLALNGQLGILITF